jgi:hypothetical protein
MLTVSDDADLYVRGMQTLLASWEVYERHPGCRKRRLINPRRRHKLAATHGRLSGPRNPSSELLAWLARSLLSISNAFRPGVAGCLGNGSMSEEAH